MPRPEKSQSIIISPLRARANFGKLWHQVEDERQSLVIEKRGTPRAILMSIRNYVRLATPELKTGFHPTQKRTSVELVLPIGLHSWL
jgi:prevent-host-death family protein